MRSQDLWPEQIGRNSRRSYNAYRAALVWCTVLEIDTLYAEFCERVAEKSAEQAHEVLGRIEAQIAILETYPPGAKNIPSLWQPPAGGAVHKSKRRGLGKLSPLWRQELLRACPPSSKYFLPLVILMLTGVRPAELRKGVLVTMEGAEIAITIQGAKVMKVAGQPQRVMWFALDNPFAKSLAARVQAAGGVRLKVAIASPGALCVFVRRLSKRVFKRHKYVVSPYSYRHAFSSDLKSEKAKPEEIGAMMGHTLDRSQRGYGCSKQGRSLCRVTGFSATRAVRHAPVSKEAAAWMAGKPSMTKQCEQQQSVSPASKTFQRPI